MAYQWHKGEEQRNHDRQYTSLKAKKKKKKKKKKKRKATKAQFFKTNDVVS